MAMQIPFERIRDESGPFDLGEKILAILEPSLQDAYSSSSSAGETADRLVQEMSEVCPSSFESTNLRDGFLENMSFLLVGVAKHVPAEHEGQVLLMETVRALKESGEPWSGLSRCLGYIMRDCWIDPTDKEDAEEEGDETYTLSEWINFNSFVARLHGSDIDQSPNFAIWQLRHGLEEQFDPGEDANCRVTVAAEWMIHAGRRILLDSLRSFDMDVGLARSYRAGSLFKGAAGMGLERWGFWKRRFAEVRPVVDGETRANVDRAIEEMAAVEKRVEEVIRASR